MSELYVEKQIESKYGNVKLTITHNDHISATVTADFRGTVYDVHVHYSIIAGAWQFKDRDSISVRRAWDGNAKNFDKPAAPTHVKAITEELKKVLDAFITANPADLVEAQRRYLIYEINHADTEIQKRETTLIEAKLKRQDLSAQFLQLELNRI